MQVANGYCIYLCRLLYSALWSNWFSRRMCGEKREKKTNVYQFINTNGAQLRHRIMSHLKHIRCIIWVYVIKFVKYCSWIWLYSVLIRTNKVDWLNSTFKKTDAWDIDLCLKKTSDKFKINMKLWEPDKQLWICSCDTVQNASQLSMRHSRPSYIISS